MKAIEKMISRIFGEQKEMGLDYIQLLITKPWQKLPILCLASNEPASGARTFTDWLQKHSANPGFELNKDWLHADNTVIDILGCCLFIISESGINSADIEILKSLTSQFTNTSGHAVNHNVIIITNDEKKLKTLIEDEIRFWVRSLDPISKDEMMDGIDEILDIETPEFIEFLSNRQLSTPESSRLWFNLDSINAANIAPNVVAA